MEVRESYKREFLQSLRESPAWDLFVTSMLSAMDFLQDHVKFKMNGLSEKNQFLPEYFPEGVPQVLEKGKIYRIVVDFKDLYIYSPNCLISADGINFKKFEKVSLQFYLKPQINLSLEESFFYVKYFHPNHVSGTDYRNYFDFYGLGKDEVKSSIFDVMNTGTSPYNLNKILKESNIPYNMEYFFSDGVGVEIKGSKQETVREGIKLEKLSDNLFYYKSDLTLIAKNDFIQYNGNLYEIKSLSNDMLISDIPVDNGIFTIVRQNFLVPLSEGNVLKSTLEIEYNKDDQVKAQRVVDRVTPVRCSQGFKGFIDVRIVTNIEVHSESNIVNHTVYSLVELESQISWILNNLLYLGRDKVTEDGVQLCDIGTSDKTYDNIILL